MSAGRKNNSPTKHWNTPPKILAVVREFFGGRIDLDPCSNEHSLVQASDQYKLPEDGLALEWFGSVFCNPPYGRNPENKTSLLDWTNKAAKSIAADGLLFGLLGETGREILERFCRSGKVCGFMKSADLS